MRIIVQVIKTTTVKKCKPKTPCKIGDYSSVGSGGVIGHENGYIAVITAGHVCSGDFAPALENMILEKETTLMIRTWKGTVVPARIIRSSDNPKIDLCAIKVTGVGFPLPRIKVSTQRPVIGNRVFSMAAPAGIYHPPTVPILEGIYSGMLEDNLNSLVTIPATGGSSGSVVLNSKKEIVGIVFAAARAFPHITLSVGYDQTKIFIRKSLKSLRAGPAANMSLEGDL